MNYGQIGRVVRAMNLLKEYNKISLKLNNCDHLSFLRGKWGKFWFFDDNFEIFDVTKEIVKQEL